MRKGFGYGIIYAHVFRVSYNSIYFYYHASIMHSLLLISITLLGN